MADEDGHVHTGRLARIGRLAIVEWQANNEGPRLISAYFANDAGEFQLSPRWLLYSIPFLRPTEPHLEIARAPEEWHDIVACLFSDHIRTNAADIAAQLDAAGIAL